MNNLDVIGAVLTKKAKSLEPIVSNIVVNSWDFKDSYKNQYGVGHPSFRISKEPELNTTGTIYIKRPEGKTDREFKNQEWYVDKWLGNEFLKNISKVFFQNTMLKNIGYNVTKNTNTNPQSLSQVSYKIVFED